MPKVVITSISVRLELPGRRPRGGPMRECMDGIKTDMYVVGVTHKDAENRVRWRKVTCCGDKGNKDKPNFAHTADLCFSVNRKKFGILMCC